MLLLILFCQFYSFHNLIVSDKNRRILLNFNIRTAFKSSYTLKNIIIIITKILLMSPKIGYAIECEFTYFCSPIYVGETKRPISIRLTQT